MLRYIKYNMTFIPSIPHEYNTAQKIKFIDGVMDQFSRIRTSEPFTLLDNNHVADDNLVQESEKRVGSGSSTYFYNKACVEQSVFTNGDVCARQTRKVGIYQPGKSLLIYMSGVLNSGNNASTVISRIGYYHDNDGLFFQYNNNEISLVKRSSVTGSIIDTVVPQSLWNGEDKLDGNGPSGITLDVTKTLLFYFSFGWLGVSNCQGGFLINGVFYTVHTFYHSNIDPDVYMQNASHPCRYEIISNGGAGKMKNICCTVISEGGYNTPGRQYSINVGITGRPMTTIPKPVIAIRIKPTTPVDINVRIMEMSLFREAPARDGVYSIYIFRDAIHTSVLTNPVWVSANPKSLVEYDISSTAINLTGGDMLQSGYYSGESTSSVNIDTKANNSNLTRNIDGISDLYIMVYQTLTSTSNVFPSISWREYF